jgi:hypothetical protein
MSTKPWSDGNPALACLKMHSRCGLGDGYSQEMKEHGDKLKTMAIGIVRIGTPRPDLQLSWYGATCLLVFDDSKWKEG